jgi:2'-5' RNA ligase
MENGFVRINIAFKPPSEAAWKAEGLSQEISRKEEAFFVLDGSHFHPHITIYPSEYPANIVDRIVEKMEILAKDFSPLEFVFKKAENHHGYISMAANYSPELRSFHEAIVETINPLRGEHLREKYIQASKTEISDAKKQNIRQYGYPDLMDLYNPHLTITRLKDEKMGEQVAKDIRWPIKRFELDTVGIYELGENGTCIRLIREFKLGRI